MDSKKRTNEEAKKAQREYMREWRRKNPERVREINLRYWAKKAREAAGDGKTDV